MNVSHQGLGLKVPMARNALEYTRLVAEFDRSALVAYWPLTDWSGNSDLGPSGYTLTPTGITYSASPFGNVSTYDGSTSRFAIPEALEGTMNFNLGTLMCWWFHPAATWGDATLRVVVHIGEDLNNRILLSKGATANNIQALRITATDSSAPSTNTTAAALGGTLNCSILTWTTADLTGTGYTNGVVHSAVLTGNAAYVGGIKTYRAIGMLTHNGTSNPWSGQLAHCAIWNRQFSAAEMAALYAMGLS